MLDQSSNRRGDFAPIAKIMLKRISFCQPLIQIAGVIDWLEAEMLLSAGCTCLGFPLRLPVNQADLSEEEARDIICRLPSTVLPVLICYEKKAAEIARFADFLGVPAVQLHGGIELAELAALRRYRPNLAVIKSLIVRAEAEFQEFVVRMRTQAPYIDAFILDSYNSVTGATGATGLVHDWSVSRALVRQCPKPVILAGGLTPANVEQAIKTVRPAGVDAHTGVEAQDGRKDLTLVRDFLLATQAGFQAIS